MSEKFEMRNEEEKKVSLLCRVAIWFVEYFLGILLLIVLPVVMVLCFVIPWKGEEITYSFSDDKQCIVAVDIKHLLFFDETQIHIYDEFYSVDGEWYIRSNAGCGFGYQKVEIEQS